MTPTHRTTDPASTQLTAGLSRVLRDHPPSLTGFLAPAVLAVLVIAVSMRSPAFLSVNSVQVLTASASVFGLLAAGQLLVILMGRIDLSTGALAALGTILLAKMLPGLGFWSVPVTLACLTAAGALNGLAHVHLQIPSFIVTLGALGLWSGVSLVVSGADAISITEGYSSIDWTTGLVGSVPREVLVAGTVLAAVAVFLRWTVAGKQVYAIGRAEEAALMSGVRVRARVVAAFTFSGFTTGLAAVVLAAEQISGDPLAAQSLLLPSIAAVVLGGNALTGGSGGVWRLVIGTLLITVLRNGIGIVGIDPSYQEIVYGVAIVAAASLTLDRSRMGIVK